ncbi:MAG: ChaN family lipoprotein [Polaromonas sp.]|nr:ChaN family lipoprotein [Polaromonas sp.]
MSSFFFLPAFITLIRRFLAVFVVMLSVSLAGCAYGLGATELQSRLNAWLPADVLLLGEQHDAPDHQALQQKIVAALAVHGDLAAVALEMADSGNSTAALAPDASEEQTLSALNWNNDAWPWAAYGPAVMSAVRAGVPVLGANLPRAEMRSNMADAALDQRLPAAALAAQQQLIRRGHCDLLPESQITPMTRIQIAKDMRMADTVQAAARPGQVVVLITGSVHADKQLGVPQHLQAERRVKAIRLRSGAAVAGGERESFDDVWLTSATPDKDYCADLAKQLPPR